MKPTLWGAAAGFLCPMLFVLAIWSIQVSAYVLAPGSEGPNYLNTAIMMVWTVIFFSPFLVLGTVVGAAVGACVAALQCRPAAADENTSADLVES